MTILKKLGEIMETFDIEAIFIGNNKNTSKSEENLNRIYIGKDGYEPPVIDDQIHLKPIFKWTGGKRREIKLFEKHFPQFIKLY